MLKVSLVLFILSLFSPVVFAQQGISMTAQAIPVNTSSGLLFDLSNLLFGDDESEEEVEAKEVPVKEEKKTFRSVRDKRRATRGNSSQTEKTKPIPISAKAPDIKLNPTTGKMNQIKASVGFEDVNQKVVCNKDNASQSSVDSKKSCSTILNSAILNVGRSNNELFDAMSVIYARTVASTGENISDVSEKFCSDCYSQLLQQETNQSPEETELLMREIENNISAYLPLSQPYEFLAKVNYGEKVVNLKAFYEPFADQIRKNLEKRIKEESPGISDIELDELLKQKEAKLQCLHFDEAFRVSDRMIEAHQNSKFNDPNDNARAESLINICKIRRERFIPELEAAIAKKQKKMIKSDKMNLQLGIGKGIFGHPLHSPVSNTAKKFIESLSSNGKTDILQSLNEEALDDFTNIVFLKNELNSNKILQNIHENQVQIKALCSQNSSHQEIIASFLGDEISTMSDKSFMDRIVMQVNQDQYLAPILTSKKGACDYIVSLDEGSLNVDSYLNYLVGGSDSINSDRIIALLESMAEESCGIGIMSGVGALICSSAAETYTTSYLNNLQELLKLPDLNETQKIVVSKMICNKTVLDGELNIAEGVAGDLTMEASPMENLYSLAGSIMQTPEDIDRATEKQVAEGKGGAFLVSPKDRKAARRERVRQALAATANGMKYATGEVAASSTPDNSIISSAESKNDQNKSDISYTDALKSVASNGNQISNLSSQTQQSIKQDIVDNDPQIKTAISDVSDDLKEQLLPGKDASKVLEDVLTGKSDITKNDLGCSLSDSEITESKMTRADLCDRKNNKLLAEIENLKKQVETQSEINQNKSENEKLKQKIASLEDQLDQFKKIPAAKAISNNNRSPASLGSNFNEGLTGTTNLSSYDTAGFLSSSAYSGSSSSSDSPQDKSIVKLIPKSVLDDPLNEDSQDLNKNEKKAATDFTLRSYGVGLFLTINEKDMENYPVNIGKLTYAEDKESGEEYLVSFNLQGSEKAIELSKLSKSSREALIEFISKRQLNIPKESVEVGRQIASLESQISENEVEIVRLQELHCALNPSRQGCAN